MNTNDLEGPITKDWLVAAGFKWSEIDLPDMRKPKHWLLWFGGTGFMQSYEDLGIEVSGDHDGKWCCWLRSDFARKYGRFIHIREIVLKTELVRIVEALSGLSWAPENHLYGAIRATEEAARIREESARLDRRLLISMAKHCAHEEDSTRSGCLPEHVEALNKAIAANKNV